jgi:hypothetical protein
MNALLDQILDTLIPASPDGRMPAAGALGLADVVRAETAGARDVVAAGLSALEERGFGELDAEGRIAALREIEADQPEFVRTLLVPTCIAYYRHPDVLEGLGMEPRPPHPKGFELEAGDLAALDRVRRRGPIYRDDAG